MTYHKLSKTGFNAPVYNPVLIPSIRELDFTGLSEPQPQRLPGLGFYAPIFRSCQLKFQFNGTAQN